MDAVKKLQRRQVVSAVWFCVVTTLPSLSFADNPIVQTITDNGAGSGCSCRLGAGRGGPGTTLVLLLLAVVVVHGRRSGGSRGRW